jgi:DNA repair exonuclease SbcCD ATPase subunit
LRGAISNKVSTLTEHKEFFETNTVCPTCQQDIEEDFRLDRIGEAQSKLQELQEGFKQLEESIKEEENRELLFTKLTKEITSLSHDISQNNTRISGLQRQSRDLQSEVQVVTDQLQNRSAEHEKLEHLREGLQSLFDQLAKKKQEINYQNFAHNLLKDGGVKTKIIKKYLPLINQQVNRYLQLMDFYINFKLDEEFVETIQSPIHDKFSYSSFSEGEKMRIDLALLFTWREVARFKNSANTNLLIMDEVFDSSLDGFGTDEFLKIIRYVIKGANIFVISHKTELLDKFENVLKFDKVKGFSKLLS